MIEGLGGTNVDMAGSAEEAINLYGQKKHDIVLSDFNLGDGANGQQLLEELHYRDLLRHDTLFVMITAENAMSVVMGALEHRPDDYLTKPFTKPMLKQRLDKALARKELLSPLLTRLNKHQYAQVILLCEKLVQDKHRMAATCLKLQAECHIRMGEMDKARSLYQQMLVQREVSWAQLGLGNCQLAMGDYGGTIETMTALIKSNPNALEAYDRMAEALQAQGHIADALKIVQDACKISPNSMQRQRLLGQLSTAYQDWDNAAKAYREAISLGRESILKTPDDYLHMFRAMLESMKKSRETGPVKVSKELPTYLRQLSTAFPSEPQVKITCQLYKTTSDCLAGLAEDKADKAFAAVKDAITQLPEPPKPYVSEHLALCHQILPEQDALAQLHYQINGKDTALATDTDVEKSSVHNKRGLLLYKDKRYQEALKQFKVAYLNDKNNINVALNVLQAMGKMTERGETIGDYKDLLNHCLYSCKRLEPTDQRFEHFRRISRLLQASSGNEA